MKIDVKKGAKLAKKEFHLRLKGKTAVFIDAANIERSLADLGVILPRFKKVPKVFSGKPFQRDIGKWIMKNSINILKVIVSLLLLVFTQLGLIRIHTTNFWHS